MLDSPEIAWNTSSVIDAILGFQHTSCRNYHSGLMIFRWCDEVVQMTHGIYLTRTPTQLLHIQRKTIR